MAKAQPQPEPEPERDIDADLIAQWAQRSQQFYDLGFEPLPALELAQRFDISVSGVRELLRKGCPHDKAFEIVT